MTACCAHTEDGGDKMRVGSGDAEDEIISPLHSGIQETIQQTGKTFEDCALHTSTRGTAVTQGGLLGDEPDKLVHIEYLLGSDVLRKKSFFERSKQSQLSRWGRLNVANRQFTRSMPGSMSSLKRSAHRTRHRSGEYIALCSF